MKSARGCLIGVLWAGALAGQSANPAFDSADVHGAALSSHFERMPADN